MTFNYDSLKPYGLNDLVDFVELMNNDDYYPFSKEGAIVDEKAISFFIRAGYVYDTVSGKWYLLNDDGLYAPIRDERVYLDIMRFLDHHARKNSFNISINNQKSIYERLRAVSMPILAGKRDDFILSHDEYSLSCDSPDFIPVLNGLINPDTMELLPHCAYFLYPNPLGFNYKKLTEDEILYSPVYDAYLGILPDKDTLELFLWWVGMVLFSDELPRVIMFLYGQGGTGKTTLSLGLSKILTPAGFSELNIPSMKTPFFTSSFVNKKLIVMDEMSSSGGLLDDSLFKKLTGGNPVFTIQEKYKNPRNEVLRAKTMMMGNTYPSFIQDSAIIDRMFIIPCLKKQDKTIRDIVTSDDALNWLFNAAYHFYVEKHPHQNVKFLSDLKTPVMIRELERYRDTDGLVFWLKEFIGTDVLNPDIVQAHLNGLSTRVIYNEYRNFTSETGGGALSQRAFHQKLRLEYHLGVKTMRPQPYAPPQRCFYIDNGGAVNEPQ